jgi:hypothetical protein
VIEFLNERMTPTEVVGVEIKQYVGRDKQTTLVPRVVGQTEQAKVLKPGGSRSPSAEVGWEYYEQQLEPGRFAIFHSLFGRMDEAVKERGLGWVPVLRSRYFSFQRPGGYNCIGVSVLLQTPIEFWIKLPLAPDELRRLGHDIPDPYPELNSHWWENDKQWSWSIPSPEAVPDIAPAIELTSRYQPPNGPMPVSTN